MFYSKKIGVQVPPRVPCYTLDNQPFRLIILASIFKATLRATPYHSYLSKSTDKMNYPYTPAHLVIPDKESKDQRWFIKFYVWDVAQNKKVKKTDYSCNKIANLIERKKQALVNVQEINQLLRTGYVIGKKETPAEKLLPQNLTIEQAILNTLSEKKQLKHYRDYHQKLHKFLNWLKGEALHQEPAQNFKSSYIRKFCQQLSAQGKGVRTINNYISTIGLVFNTTKKQNEGLVIENPVLFIDKKKNPKGKNVAFTQKEQSQLMAYMEENNRWMMLYCITMFYTLARTDELAKLQFWMIGHFDPNKIYMPAGIVKNGHNSGIDKHIVMPLQLQEWFAKFDFNKYPPNWYVFGNRFEPSAKPYPSKYVGQRFRTNVLDKFGFGKEYTLYSWKATGTSMYLLNGATQGSLMLQGGWEDPNSFKAYLKSLGLLDNKEIFKTAPELKINKK